MPLPRPTEKIHAAAYHFAHISRDLHDIAEAWGVSVWTVRDWAKASEWENALNAFGYQGDRTFTKRLTRDPAREDTRFQDAKDCYLQALREGVPSHKLPSIVSEQTGLPKRRIYEWAKRYCWKAQR